MAQQAAQKARERKAGVMAGEGLGDGGVKKMTVADFAGEFLSPKNMRC